MKEGTFLSVVDVAQICHEANKVFCALDKDHSQDSWENAPVWQKVSAVDGVKFHLSNPDASESAAHDNWTRDKIRTGWVWGHTKDAELKTHPCLLPFNELSSQQQAKDHLFKGIIGSLRPFIVVPVEEEGAFTGRIEGSVA